MLPLSTEKPALGTDSKISIAELLDYVNRYFPDILPEEVLKHYGHDFRPEGELGEAALYSDRSTDSVSNRTLLADALESTTQHDVERKKLQEYKSKMPNKDVAEIQSLIKHEAKTSDNYLGIDAKWLYNKQKGHEYFARYSTADEQGPTMFYARKGAAATYEYEWLMQAIEKEAKIDGYYYSGARTLAGVLDRVKNAPYKQAGNSSTTSGSGGNAGNATLHSRNGRNRLSAAFQNCIKNSDEVQSRYGVDDHYQFAVDRGDLKTATASLIVIVGIKRFSSKKMYFRLMTRLIVIHMRWLNGGQRGGLSMKQKLPEKYINRSKLLQLSLDKNLSDDMFLQMVFPMQNKTEEEKEAMAAELIKQLEA